MLELGEAFAAKRRGEDAATRSQRRDDGSLRQDRKSSIQQSRETARDRRPDLLFSLKQSVITRRHRCFIATQWGVAGQAGVS